VGPRAAEGWEALGRPLSGAGLGPFKARGAACSPEEIEMAGIPVTIIGEAYYTGLGVGGGPMPGGPGPAHPIAPGGPPPGIWPSPGHPAHPIAPGGSPPGIWGGGNEGFPTHPIVIPPGFIDGVHPEHPIVIPPPAMPGYPAHPIVIPPEVWPPDARPEHPIVIPPPPVVWPPRPTHPIVIPPPPEVPEVMVNWEVVTYWNVESGWGVAIVPSGDQPIVTPSGG
jgi:hypothetical protein